LLQRDGIYARLNRLQQRGSDNLEEAMTHL
jgi:hypothetical protein